MKLLLVAGMCIVLGICAFFFFRDEVVLTNFPPKNSTIVAFGDSLVEGVGATEGNDFVSVLSRTIGLPIKNLGVRGDTTADGVSRVTAVKQYDPGIVLLLLGGNDTLRQIPVATTEKNLRTLIESFHKEGALVVFIGVRGGIIGSEREDMYERISREYGALYVPDILDGLLLKPEFMFDNIHPNDAGYARIAERLSAVLEDNNLLK